MSARAVTANVSRWKLWLALLGGAVAWTGHLLLAYAIAEFGCVAGLGHRSLLGVTALSCMLMAISVLMAALAAWAVIISFRIGRLAQSAWPDDPDDRATGEYVARFGIIADGLFLFIILVQCVPIFFYWGQC